MPSCEEQIKGLQTALLRVKQTMPSDKRVTGRRGGLGLSSTLVCSTREEKGEQGARGARSHWSHWESPREEGHRRGMSGSQPYSLRFLSTKRVLTVVKCN